jgi:hypothetical protein
LSINKQCFRVRINIKSLDITFYIRIQEVLTFQIPNHKSDIWIVAVVDEAEAEEDMAMEEVLITVEEEVEVVDLMALSMAHTRIYY